MVFVCMAADTIMAVGLQGLSAAPSKPRFRHSSITWQLHSAAMARRDDAAAQLAAGLAAKPIEEEQEPEAAETADEEVGLQMTELNNPCCVFVSSLQLILTWSM